MLVCHPLATGPRSQWHGGHHDLPAADQWREQCLAARGPGVYNPLLALRPAPLDVTAKAVPRQVNLATAQWPLGPTRLSSSRPCLDELLVLPELSGLPSGLTPDRIARSDEKPPPPCSGRDSAELPARIRSSPREISVVCCSPSRPTVPAAMMRCACSAIAAVSGPTSATLATA